MLLRAFDSADLGGVASIERACFAESWTLEMLKATLASDRTICFVAKEGEQVIAFILGSVLFEDAELARVAVLPQYRGQKIGRKLVGALLEEAQKRGAEQMFLEVRPSNERALALYLSYGFIKTRLRKRYYADGEDCIEMKKLFKGEE